MSLCFPEQVLVNSESGELDLNIKLKDLSTDVPQFFAVHFAYLKATPLGGLPL